jgi:hypothetical protein
MPRKITLAQLLGYEHISIEVKLAYTNNATGELT